MFTAKTISRDHQQDSSSRGPQKSNQTFLMIHASEILLEKNINIKAV